MGEASVGMGGASVGVGGVSVGVGGASGGMGGALSKLSALQQCVFAVGAILWERLDARPGPGKHS